MNKGLPPLPARRVERVSCPRCGAPPDRPCQPAGDWLRSHKARHRALGDLKRKQAGLVEVAGRIKRWDAGWEGM